MNKIIKKVFQIIKIIILLLILFLNFTYAEKNNLNKLDEDDKSNYKEYLENIKKKCIIYKPKKPSFKTTEYPSELKNPKPIIEFKVKNKNDLLEVGSNIYKSNQNNIYKCSIIKAQQNSFTLVKNKLLKMDKTGEVVSRVKKDIELKESKLKSVAKRAKCKITDKKKIFAKKDVLQETTYELCKYTFYLEYLKKYYDNLERSINVTETQKTQTYQINKILNAYSNLQTKITNEKYHSYKVYELAFQSYSEYENNLPIHILLELLKQDFIVYRKKLHDTINPLNQVLYKIVNAMSK